MDERDRDFRRLPSFVLGGLLGASAVLATARRRRRVEARRSAPAGLAAFEQAPCYREAVERDPASPPRDS
jgi:hypothetical protein